MTASSSTVDVSSFSTDAKFRTWGLAISSALTASGLTQTADTGQINWTTVLRPTAAITKAGYEVWRFNDSLQATRPIFLKIEYGSNNHASGQNPGLWLTVGTATDGAGTVSGMGLPVVALFSASTVASTNTTALVGAAYSTAAGAMSLLGGLLAMTTIHPGCWTVSRTCDSSGVPTGDGVSVSYVPSVGNVTTRSATYSPPVQYAAFTGTACGVPYPAASVSSGGSVQLYKNYAWLGVLHPIMGQLSYYTTDIVAMTSFAAAPFGATSRTYLPLGVANATAFNSNNSNTSSIAAVIWE